MFQKITNKIDNALQHDMFEKTLTSKYSEVRSLFELSFGRNKTSKYNAKRLRASSQVVNFIGVKGQIKHERKTHFFKRVETGLRRHQEKTARRVLRTICTGHVDCDPGNACMDITQGSPVNDSCMAGSSCACGSYGPVRSAQAD